MTFIVYIGHWYFYSIIGFVEVKYLLELSKCVVIHPSVDHKDLNHEKKTMCPLGTTIAVQIKNWFVSFSVPENVYYYLYANTTTCDSYSRGGVEKYENKMSTCVDCQSLYFKRVLIVLDFEAIT